jgi:hypothetical protein
MTARSEAALRSDDVARPGGSTWRRRDFAVLGAVGALQGTLRMASPGDGDILWGAKSGLDTLRQGQIPRHDSYSWSALGHAWIPSSWGWNVVLGVVYDVFGMAGFVVAAAGLGAALGAVVAALARRIGAGPPHTALVLSVLGIFALGGAPRATAVSAIAAPLLVLLMPAVLSGDSAKWWGRLGLVLLAQLGWVNLHSGALLAPVLALAFGAGIAMRQDATVRRRTAFRLAITVPALAVACLATPYGWGLVAHAPKVRAASVGVIEEWRHFSLHTLATPVGAVFAAAVVLAVATAIRSRRYESLLVLLVMTGLTISSVRFIAATLVFVIPEVALASGGLAVRRRVLQAAVAALAVGFVAVGAISLADAHKTEETWDARRLVAAIPPSCRLFNDDAVGGAVILLRPDVPVWTDGRNDMYGRSRTLLTLSLRDWAPGTLRWIDRNKITCVLVRSSDPLAQHLAHISGWESVDSDDERTLLVRTPAG